MVTLTQLFISKQGEMAAQFKTPLEHPVAKGDNFESAWTNFLKAYLPTRYECGNGFIVDSRNNVSDQIDIIIYDKYFSPFFLPSFHQCSEILKSKQIYSQCLLLTCGYSS